jgi:hypothetical protein
MARTGKLSAVEVAKANGPAVLHDGGGIYLRVSTTDTKSWVFRFQLDGKRRDMALGPYPDISLAEARGRATEHRKLRHNGIDPLQAKEAQRRAQRPSVARGRTFREMAEEFISRNEVGWRNANTGRSGAIPASPMSTRSWGIAGRSNRYWACRPGSRRDLDRDGEPGVAALRRSSTLRRCAAGTEPGAVERQLRSYSSRARQGAEGGASCRTTL